MGTSTNSFIGFPKSNKGLDGLNLLSLRESNSKKNNHATFLRVVELELQLEQERKLHQQQISSAVLKTIEKERTYLGQELHDNINQILGCASLYFRLLQTHCEEQTRAKEKGMELILLAINEIRKLSRAMVLPKLADENIRESINHLLDDFQKASGIRIHFDCRLEGRQLGVAKKETLFRILQEQLKNTLVHSQATEVRISLISTCKDVQLWVADNGIGVQENVKSNGIGLENIRSRVQQHSGTVHIRSHPGKGFHLEVRLPRNKKCGKQIAEKITTWTMKKCL